MADEYNQPQLHRHHEAEGVGEKREFLNDKNNDSAAFVDASDADMATTQSTDRGLFGSVGKAEKKGDDEVEQQPPAYETIDSVVGDENGVDAKDRGGFGNFTGDKKAEEDERDTMRIELEKLSIAEPEEKKGDEFKVEEKENENKLHKSYNTGSRSNEDEEGNEEEKKENQRGLEEKIKQLVSGEEKEEEKKTLAKEVESAYIEPPAGEVYVEPSADQVEKKMDLMDEIKDKLPVSGESRNSENAHPSSLPVAEETVTQETEPKEKLPVSGETGNTENASPPSLPVAEQTATQEKEPKDQLPVSGEHGNTENALPSSLPVAEEPATQEAKPKEKKGILEKIKEILPGNQPKSTET